MYDLLVMVNRFNQKTVVKGRFPNWMNYASLVLIYPFCGLLTDWTLLIDGKIRCVGILIARLKDIGDGKSLVSGRLSGTGVIGARRYLFSQLLLARPAPNSPEMTDALYAGGLVLPRQLICRVSRGSSGLPSCAARH
jgi:hypothetical protein